MAVKIQNQLGNIDISNDVIATVVGGAATEIFGIVGMASKNQIRDNLNEILRRDNYSKGVVVRQQERHCTRCTCYWRLNIFWNLDCQGG